MSAQGAAHEAASGSLADFEDADGAEEASDLSQILGPRRRTDSKPKQPTKRRTSAGTAPTPQAAEAPTGKTQGKPTKKGTSQRSTIPKPSEARNVIRSSSIHVPADLIPLLTRYREDHHMSNGQVVIAAIEAAHPKLKQLIHPETAGGTLFAERATKGVRTSEGPLTPLNVRLFVEDYDVIDTLVRDNGAFSRGHLVTVSLQEFLT